MQKAGAIPAFRFCRHRLSPRSLTLTRAHRAPECVEANTAGLLFRRYRSILPGMPFEQRRKENDRDQKHSIEDHVPMLQDGEA